jgi:hypothetical protein
MNTTPQERFVCASHGFDHRHDGSRHDQPNQLDANRAGHPLQSQDRGSIGGMPMPVSTMQIRRAIREIFFHPISDLTSRSACT